MRARVNILVLSLSIVRHLSCVSPSFCAGSDAIRSRDGELSQAPQRGRITRAAPKQRRQAAHRIKSSGWQLRLTFTFTRRLCWTTFLDLAVRSHRVSASSTCCCKKMQVAGTILELCFCVPPDVRRDVNDTRASNAAMSAENRMYWLPRAMPDASQNGF